MRHALYFVPEDGSALARFGNAVLGRDARGRALRPDADFPTAPPAWTRAPARYGFHATLKAPFALADGVDEDALAEGCTALARRHRRVPMAALAPRAFEGFTALALPAAEPAIDALAADCVGALDALRAPLDAAALARRRPEALAPDARARLERWGYPHVLEGFRFHMTLSGVLPGEAPEVLAWRAALARRYARDVGAGAVLDRLALCREAEPGAAFVRVAEFPLGRR